MPQDTSPPARTGSPDAGPAAARLAFPVVGVGASAGGLVALERLLEPLPANPGFAIVVVLHLSPRHESHADQILQRFSAMPVQQVTGSTPIEADHVYVIPPTCDLMMQNGALHIRRGLRSAGPQVAIDLFLRSLAEAHGDRAIGVILSGSGSDGTVGLARLKERGGVTFAQDPGECEYADMPRNAIVSGHVDFVLPAAGIARKLQELEENARRLALPPLEDDEPPLSAQVQRDQAHEAALRDIVQLLAERTGHDFSHYKRATMLRRMERRLQVRTLPDLPAYRDFLLDHAEEASLLLEDMLISVTNFFRDPEVFESLERNVVPELVRRAQSGVPARAWVVGCATGEEAYSLAIALASGAQGRTPPATFQVFATDIDEQALARARRGLYPASIAADVPPERLAEFFQPEQGRYRICKSIRERVMFAAHNMLRDPPFSRLDLISCRNTLIYLNRDIQDKLLEMFHFALRPGGYLLLGSSESVDTEGGLFEAVDKKQRIFRANAPLDGTRRTPAMPLRVGGGRLAVPGAPPARNPALSFAELHQRVLEQYAPPSVIVDRASNVVHMSEHAGQFLRHGAGVPSNNLLTLVHPALRVELRTALFQAVQTGHSVEACRVRLKRGGSASYVNMIARPFSDAEAGAEFVLVLFEEVQVSMASDGDADAARDARAPREDSVVVQLESELARTRAQLQATIEQAETSGEELKASNEELQAINEELRSTTEELETGAEELQSVNEELVTVNAELRAKVDETERANDDLGNFIAATDIATVFVDSTMFIRRYTPAAGGLFNLIPSDIGRSLMDITHRLAYPQLADDLAGVLATLQAVEREVMAAGSRHFIARIRPYQTTARQVEGAVLSFVDVSSLREAEAGVVQAGEDMRQALVKSNDVAVVATDAAGQVTGWNGGASSLFGYQREDMAGRTLHALFVAEDVAAGVPEHEMACARDTGRALDDRWYLRKDGTRVYCSGVMVALDVGGLRGYVAILREAGDDAQVESRGPAQPAGAGSARAGHPTTTPQDEFLALVSHELKHPLNLINVNAELIARSLEGQGDSALVGPALSTIARAVRSQSRIVDDLLELSRIRSGALALDLAAVDLAALARSAVETAAADASAAEVQVGLAAGAGLVLVDADAVRIRQVLSILLGNAVKHTPDGGRVEVRVSEEDGFGRVDVIDSGQGIDPAVLPRIFELFGQARGRDEVDEGGPDIGLAMVRQLVEDHGGRVEAASAGVGQGARFTAWLPRHAARLGTETAGEARPRSCAGMRILVVDDDRHTVDALSALLAMEGATVAVATSGQAALALATVAPAPDVVLTDLGMPRMDGYALLRQLRAHPETRAVPVIALTGFARNKDEGRAREAGFAAHIAKPVSIPQLLQRICEVVPALPAAAATDAPGGQASAQS